MAKLFRSVAFKLSLLTSLFVLSVIALMARHLLKKTEEALQGEMRVRAEFFARSAREAVFPKLDAFALNFHVSELAKEKAVVYAAALDSGGKVLSHSDPARIGTTPGDAATRAALAAREPLLQTIPPQEGGREPSYAFSLPIRVGEKRLGTTMLGYNRSSINEALREPKRQILAIATLGVLATVLGTVIITGWITRPLPLLAEAAREAGRGNFGVRVESTSRDEIGTLTRAFNDMAIAATLMFTTLKEEKERMETLFGQIREGLVWTQSNGKILLINPAARQLLGCGNTAPGTMADALSGFVPNPRLEAVLDSTARSTPVEFERSAPKLLTLSGVADRLGGEGEPASYLFLFRDATIEKREEVMSRNFLSFVSHKLRTPLMVALGYLELLRQDKTGLSEFQANALAKIQREDETLRALVEKLIRFSAVQRPEAIFLDRAPTHLKDVVESAMRLLETMLLTNRVELEVNRDVLAAVPPLDADAPLLVEVLKNLIENAVKFNPAFRKEVTILAQAENGMACVSVSDNGPGIPGEEHPKLFKKFYQIDEHFTGQVPGMGLGLVFVRNVVSAHGGEVGMRSTIGKGSEFYFTIPLTKT